MSKDTLVGLAAIVLAIAGIFGLSYALFSYHKAKEAPCVAKGGVMLKSMAGEGVCIKVEQIK